MGPSCQHAFFLQSPTDAITFFLILILCPSSYSCSVKLHSEVQACTVGSGHMGTLLVCKVTGKMIQGHRKKNVDCSHPMKDHHLDDIICNLIFSVFVNKSTEKRH